MAAIILFQMLLDHSKLLLATIFLSWYLHSYFISALRPIPGPFWAKLTNLWRLIDVWKGHAQTTHIQLHRKHGEYVRLGPNSVSISNDSAIKTVYGINNGYEKSEFYRVQQQMKEGKAVVTLFTSTSETFHASIKRPISNAYSMTILTEFEPFVDRTIQVFFDQLTHRFISRENAGKECNISKWLQFYAFDVIGELTFSRRLGFLDRGEDVNNIMADLGKVMEYNALVGQIPWLDYIFKKNPFLNKILKPTGQVARFAQERLQERLENPKESDAPNRDFLDRFINAQEKYPNVVTEGQIMSYTITNVFAGSDTTAISLRAVIYYTLKSPRVLVKLQQELSDASASGKLSYPVSWKESQELPYLDAVIKEALRLHPAVGLPLERVVPASGLKLPNGVLLPAGTIVGTSPWVANRNQAVFGENIDSFHPERWLKAPDESDAAWKHRRLNMASATFTFGAGPRTCIGKNISLLEIYKLIPSLFLKFEIELVNPEQDWMVRNAWFVSQGSIPVKLRLSSWASGNKDF